MRALVLLVLVVYLVSLSSSVQTEIEEDPVTALTILKKLHDLELITGEEYETRKTVVLDKLTGQVGAPMSNGTVYSSQVKFLLDQFVLGLPRSYSTILPTGENFWHTSIYLEYV